MKILCVGDVGLDEYVTRKEIYIGGCAFNVYQSLNLAHKALLCPLGEDFYSTKIRAILSADKNIYLPLFPCPPSKQTINIFESGEKNFLQFYPGPWEKWRASKDDIDLIDKFDLCHTVIYEQNVQAVNSYLKGQKWAIDFTTMRDFNEDVRFVKEYLPYLKYAFFGLDRSQEKLKEELVGLFAASDVELVMTFGAEGSEVHQQGKIHRIKATPVKLVVDTTGAGDAYIGAYLSARARSQTIAQAMLEASQRASVIVQTISLGNIFKLI